MLKVIDKLGRHGLTFVVTVLSILASVLITITVLRLAGYNESLKIGVSIAILCPLIIAPLISYHLIGLLIRIQKLEAQQKQLLAYDALTGLMTRRAYFENSESLFRLIQRREDHLTIAYIDIDNFKKINDQYGHHVGDKVMQSLASVLQDNLRVSDITGRIGGEEFTVSMPYTGLQKAEKIMQRIRELSHQNTIEHKGQTIQYSISVGLAAHEQENTKTLEELIHRSDQALYRAKQQGKNRVVSYDDSWTNNVMMS